MIENQRMPENRGDDLDLIGVLAGFFRFFRKYGSLIGFFSLSGLIAGVFLFISTPKKYNSTILLHSYTLPNTEQINIIEGWNDLLKNREYNILSERLNCSPELLRKIYKIEAAELQKLYSTNNPNGFIVEAMVKDNSILDSLEIGIRYGLENSDYIKAKLSGRRADLLELISKVKTEITNLDSTKNKIENNFNNLSPRSSFIIDVSNINTQVISLNEKLLGYQEELKFTNAVQVLRKFEKFERPTSPKLFKLLLLGLIGGFALGYIISIFAYLRKKLKRIPL